MLQENYPKATVLEILFENRNKAYGAYELRTNYNKRLLMAMATVSLLIVLIALLLNMPSDTKKQHTPILDLTGRLVNVQIEQDKPIEIPKNQVQPKSSGAKPVATEPYNKPNIVPDPQVKNSMPNIDKLDSVAIADKHAEGMAIPFSENPTPNTQKGTGTNGTGTEPNTTPNISTPAIDDSKPFETAEIMPEFPGGNAALIRFMEQHLKQPDDLEDKSSIKVIAKFVVDPSGNITNIKIHQSGREDLNNEVLRVIQMMPKWKAGSQNGHKVPVFFKLPVTFIAN